MHLKKQCLHPNKSKHETQTQKVHYNDESQILRMLAERAILLTQKEIQQ